MNLYQTQYFRLILSLAWIVILLSACNNDEPSPFITPDYGYVAHIDSPIENSTFHLGDTLPISISYLS
jgi:hypothetical protein